MKTPTLSTFARHYIACALWSSNDESTPQGGEPLDANYCVEDFAPEAIAQAVADCARFQVENAADILAAGLTQERAGHNFWLNRNGHGSGFWDEYSRDDPRHEACERLSQASNAAGSRDLYLGDDGKIYQS